MSKVQPTFVRCKSWRKCLRGNNSSAANALAWTSWNALLSALTEPFHGPAVYYSHSLRRTKAAYIMWKPCVNSWDKAQFQQPRPISASASAVRLRC